MTGRYQKNQGETPVENRYSLFAAAIRSALWRSACLRGVVLVSALLLAAQPLVAGGTLKGKVADRGTKDALPGAHIIVRGTSIGAAAGLDGEYSIPNAPSGEQTIVVTYIGYITRTAVVNVPEGGTVVQDFFLSATTIEGEEVVVTAQGQGQLQAINQQLASDKIANIVSEGRIQELPDFNAAQAISRLPGVSTLQSSGEANKVVIRGLAPQFNQVAVSGISLASTGSTSIGVTSLGLTAGYASQDRSVDLTMITPYMVKSIAVYKTLTPDLNANAVGGLVNMELRQAPDEFHADLIWQSGYTAKTNRYGNFRTIGSVSDRFLDGLLGVYLLGNVENYDRASDNMTAGYDLPSAIIKPDGYKAIKVRTVGLTRHVETRKRYGLNAIIDYALPSGSIRSVNMLSRLDANAQDYVTNLQYNVGRVDFTYRDLKTKTDLAVNTLEFENDFGFLSANIKIANTYSRNHLPGSPFYQFSQSGAINTGGVSFNDMPPEALITRVNYSGAASTYLNNISLFSADYKENDQIYKADIKVPLPLEGDISGYVKVGGEFRFNYRTMDQATPYLELRRGNSQIANAVMDSIRARYPIYYDSSQARFPATNFTAVDDYLRGAFLDDRFGQILWACDPKMIDAILNYTKADPRFNAAEAGATNPGGWYDGGFQHLPNDYKFVERYYAGYLMSELSYGPDFKVVGGARWEQVASLFETFNLMDGRNPLAQNVYPATRYPQNSFLLPMVQAKYNIFDWLDVRYSFTTTVARPDYHQLSPHITMSNDRLNVWAGNPRLQPARSFNHDLQFTLHGNDIGLISIGAFFKTVRGFTYYTQYRLHRAYDPITRITYVIPPGIDSIFTYQIGATPPNNGAWLYSYINSPYDAFVRGIEADIQMRFWYLPEPLNGMVLGVNYTRISSSATYPWRDDRARTDPVTRLTTVTIIDSSRTGRLIWQPDDVLNAYVGLDYRGFSGRVSFVFQGNSVSNIGRFAEEDGFTKDYFRIDASARQMLPIEGLQLFLDITNINARKNQSAQASIGAFTNEQNYGLVANLGVRFTL
jgi:TonB-dependent receptor